MNDLKHLVEKGMQENPDADVFSILYDGKKLWVKNARPTGSNAFHKFAYRLIGNPLIVPVNDKSASEAALYEATKLQRLHDLGINVPRVRESTERYFALEDCGPTINDLMHDTLVSDPPALFEKVVEQLSILHNQNEFHGSSQIKNFTYMQESDAVYFIDFEESFDEKVAMADLQFRDLILFLLSLSRLKIALDYAPLLEKYIALTGKEDILERFRILISKVSFLMAVIPNKQVWKLLDNDTKGIYTLLKQIQQIPELKK